MKHFRPFRLIGVVHLKPLPGAPRHSQSMSAIVKAALADALAYERGGADAVCIENFGDVPFTKGSVSPETIAAMAVCGQAVREAVKIPIGFNVLRNDPRSGLGLAVVCGGSFIRVNVHSGAMLTDQGMIEGDAFNTLRTRSTLAPDVAIFADIHVKHATVIGNQSIEDAAKDTLQRGLADALIVSGTGTGAEVDPGDLQRARAACPNAPIYLGSGVTAENVSAFDQHATGYIVGSSLKRGGRLDAPVDVQRVAKLVGQL
jgi:uncharacterized protein